MTYEYVYVHRFMFLYMLLFVCLFSLGLVPSQNRPPIFGGPFLWKTAENQISRFQASTTTYIKDLGKPKWQYPTQEGTCWPCCFCLGGGARYMAWGDLFEFLNIPGLCFLWTRNQMGPLGERNRRTVGTLSFRVQGPEFLSFDLHSLPFRVVCLARLKFGSIILSEHKEGFFYPSRPVKKKKHVKSALKTFGLPPHHSQKGWVSDPTGSFSGDRLFP